MIWLAPGAFAALVLLAGPLIVHLLARRNARRLVFPATHFVRATKAATVALRRPSDIGLLLLRLAIVAVAVLAAAGPLVMTPWRLARWNARVSRAVVVDTSRGMSAPDAATRLADQEVQNAFAARRLEAPWLSDGMDRAVSWLQATAPSLREVVVISDFRRGSLDAETLRGIPAETGIRFIRAGVPPDTRRVDPPPVAGWRGSTWQASATIDAAGTRASWSTRGVANPPRWISVAAHPFDATDADRALRAAVALGVPAGDDRRRVLVTFTGAATLAPPSEPVQSPWIASAALAFKRSDLLRDVDPGVTVRERDGVMVVEAPMPATGFAAPAVIRAAILAVRPAAIIDREEEVVTLPDAALARWRREPAPVTAPAVPRADDSDQRWFWALALVLLVVEARLRCLQGRAVEREAHANAA
jgi:aerotolerance regulator-like protein